MGTEQLYLIIGFLLGTMLTGCLLTIMFILWYEHYHKNPIDKE